MLDRIDAQSAFAPGHAHEHAGDRAEPGDFFRRMVSLLAALSLAAFAFWLLLGLASDAGADACTSDFVATCCVEAVDPRIDARCADPLTELP
jgi:hypothetical protein